MDIKTRYATQKDLAKIYGMYLDALGEIPEYEGQINPERCLETITESWLTAPCVLLEKESDIVGFAGLMLTKPCHTNTPILTEYMFYILPDFRSVKLAKMLSDAAKDVADQMGIKIWFTHYVGKSDVATKEKFLKRWGYKVYGLNVTYGGFNG